MGLFTRVILTESDDTIERFGQAHRGTLHGSHGNKAQSKLAGKQMRNDGKPDGFLTKGKRHP